MKTPLMMEEDIDERRLESCKGCSSASGECNANSRIIRLKVMVDDHIQWLKEDLQQLKSLDGMSRGPISSCKMSNDKTIEKLLEVDQRVDALRDVFAVGFEQINAMICLKEDVLDELQLKHELDREVSIIVFQDYVRGLRDEYETKLYGQTVFINNLHKNAQKKVSELNALRDELHVILEEANSPENFEERSVTKKKEHFPVKVLGNHNFPLQIEENVEMTRGKSGDSGDHTLDIVHLPQVKQMTKEELLAYCKNEMTMMRRRHDSELLEKTEELFRFKREILKEKGSSPIRKDKELEHLKKKVEQFALKFDRLLKEETLPQLCNPEDDLWGFKEREFYLLSENNRLERLLRKKTNELNCLSSQISHVANQMSLHSSLEANYSKQLMKLESQIDDVKIESYLNSKLYNTVLRGLNDEHQYILQDFEVEIEAQLDFYTYVFSGVIFDAVSNMNPPMLKSHEEKKSLEALVSEKENALKLQLEENDKLKKAISSISSSMSENEKLKTSFEALLLEKENVLRLEIEESHKLKQSMMSLSSLFEEKEKLALEAQTVLIQHKEQLDAIYQELSMLRELNSKQEAQLSGYKLESQSLKSRLNETLQQIHHYELATDKLKENIKIASDALKDVEEQKIMLLGVIEDNHRAISSSFEKDKDQVKQLESITKFTMELCTSFTDLERLFIEGTKRNDSRLKLLNHQLNQLVQLADQQKKKCLRYKIMLEIRCSDLEKAESEVDLLGDEVEALVGLLGKIYLALDHYSSILQHYPGVMEILKMIQRELNGRES